MMIIILLILAQLVSTGAQVATNDACSGTTVIVEGTEGTIASTNYPEEYLNSAVCQWRIETPENMRIAVRFESLFDVETFLGFFCSDVLQFIEQNTEFCGSKPPLAFVSDSNVLSVKFETDATNTQSGFSFNWTAVDASIIPDPVVINITADEGQITSPGFPENYEPFLDYTWKISGSLGKVMLIQFDPAFDINGGGIFCSFDRLAIYEGTEASSLEYSKFLCGSNLISQTEMFFREDIFVRFTTDSDGTGRGFSFNFSAVEEPSCDGITHQNGTSGVISTPYYPLRYKANMNCTWVVTAPEDYVIAVQFNRDFSLLSSYACSLEYLQVFDGATQFLHDFCEDRAPRNFVTTGNVFNVIFISALTDGETTGFSITWMAEKKCTPSEFTCWDGNCISNDMTCDGSIDCPADIADEASCSEAGSKICGVPDVAPEFKWHSRIVGGYEAVKGSWPWQGKLSIVLNGVESFICGSSLLSEDWVLTAAHCIITGVDKMYVTFGEHDRSTTDPEAEQKIAVDKLIAHPNYNYLDQFGFVEGYDIAILHLSEPVNYTKWVKPVCLPTEEPKTGQDVIIIGWGRTKFTSDVDTSIVLRQVVTSVIDRNECATLLEYTNGVPDSIICAGLPETGGASSCNGDSGGPVLTVQNGTWAVVGVVSFGVECGETEIPGGYSNVYNVLPFINNVLTNGLPTPSIYNEIIKDQSSGVIASPNYGKGNYSPGQHHRWWIVVNEKQRIQIRFNNSFRIERHQYQYPCGGDYLNVYDGGYTSSRKYGDKRFCGYNPPPSMESQTNQVIIEFFTDYVFEDTGFSLSWQAVDGCGSDEFRCWNQSCLPMSAKCNGIAECPSKVDEYECVLGAPGRKECGKQEIAPDFPFTPLIIGGNNIKEGSWPWQVALYALSEEEFQFQCGGTLISEDWVMTAAHCVGALQMQVVIGEYSLSMDSPQEKRINVRRQLSNPDYEIYGSGDIAFLRLETPVDFSSTWYKPACLPENGTMNPPIGSQCVITGWGLRVPVRGYNPPDIMQQLSVNILNDSECQTGFSYVPNGQETLLCTGHTDEDVGACFGDSGGPLVCLTDGRWVQYGIASFIIDYCGFRGFYEKTAQHLEMIKNVIENIKPCNELNVQEGSSGVISPITFGGQYLTSFSCSWLIRGPPNTVIVIHIDNIDLEHCSSYDGIFDFLNIYDGSSAAARQVFDQSVCSETQTLRGFESSTNEVLITFFSDDSVVGAGFQISWKALADCTNDQFRCWDGTCIENEMKCDGQPHCDDSSDEKECPIRDGECGKQAIAPDFVWHSRIAGGHYAKNGSWPFIVQILSFFEFACAGTIINNGWVLTAASCVEYSDAFDLFIIWGETELNPSEATLHLVYDIHITDGSYSEREKVALLEIDGEIEYSDTVQPACLSLPGETGEPEEGEQCVALGWGETSVGAAGFLRQALVPIASEDICNYTATNRERQFCGGDIRGGVGACALDVGGPLMCFRDNVWVQCGIMTDSNACGVQGAFDVFTRVSAFMNWIEERTNMTLPSHTTTTTAAAPTEPTTLPGSNETNSVHTETEMTPPSTESSTPDESTTGGTTTPLSTTSTASSLGHLGVWMFTGLLCMLFYNY